MRYETNVSNGVTNVEFDRKDIEMNKMGITTLESKFRIFDMRTQHPTAGFTCLSEKAHKATVWYVFLGNTPHTYFIGIFFIFER